MAGRRHPAVGFLVFLLALAAGWTSVPQAQTRASDAKSTAKWVVPRTADGRPDFQGIWANNTVTPLQRPKQWEGKTRLTDAEVAELQRVSPADHENDGDAQFGDGLINAVLNRVAKPSSYDPGTGNYNQFWLVERDWHDRRTSLITDPPDGKLPPMTPEGAETPRREPEYRKAHAFEDPEMFRSANAASTSPSPRLQAGYNSYLQFVQAPTHVMIMEEMAHDARIIPIDGRPHLPAGIRPWNGDSRGPLGRRHAGRRDDQLLAEERLHGVARKPAADRTVHASSADILNYEFTVNDPHHLDGAVDGDDSAEVALTLVAIARTCAASSRQSKAVASRVCAAIPQHPVMKFLCYRTTNTCASSTPPSASPRR